ncbi:hypothetical protein ACFY9S_00900 [Streptomyces sp. NPDC012474]
MAARDLRERIKRLAIGRRPASGVPLPTEPEQREPAGCRKRTSLN